MSGKGDEIEADEARIAVVLQIDIVEYDDGACQINEKMRLAVERKAHGKVLWLFWRGFDDHGTGRGLAL